MATGSPDARQWNPGPDVPQTLTDPGFRCRSIQATFVMMQVGTGCLWDMGSGLNFRVKEKAENSGHAPNLECKKDEFQGQHMQLNRIETVFHNKAACQ
jgi:hypothetical protein